MVMLQLSQIRMWTVKTSYMWSFIQIYMCLIHWKTRGMREKLLLLWSLNCKMLREGVSRQLIHKEDLCSAEGGLLTVIFNLKKRLIYLLIHLFLLQFLVFRHTKTRRGKKPYSNKWNDFNLPLFNRKGNSIE